MKHKLEITWTSAGKIQEGATPITSLLDASQREYLRVVRKAARILLMDIIDYQAQTASIQLRIANET